MYGLKNEPSSHGFFNNLFPLMFSDIFLELINSYGEETFNLSEVQHYLHFTSIALPLLHLRGKALPGEEAGFGSVFFWLGETCCSLHSASFYYNVNSTPSFLPHSMEETHFTQLKQYCCAGKSTLGHK